MKKKFVALMLVVAMLAIAIVGGTLAYFTDADAQTNVFAVGDVQIDLSEIAAVYDKDGNEMVGKTVQTDDGATYTNLMPTNKIVKTPTVTNTGSNDAYVRVVVTLNNAFELNAAIDQVYEELGMTADEVQAVYDQVFEGWDINYNPRPAAHGANDARGICDRETNDVLLAVDFTKAVDSYHWKHSLFGLKNWFQNDAEKEAAAQGKFEIYPEGAYAGYYTNGMENGEIRYVFYLKLAAGASYTLFNGLNVPADFDNNRIVGDKVIDQMAFFDGLNIDIKADAIQVEGFDTPEDAFTALEAAHPIA